MTLEENIAAELLAQHGYEVERVAEAAEGKRADFLAWRGDECLVVEVKTREERHSFLRELEVNGRASYVESTGYRNSLARRLLLASRQIDDTPAADHPLGVCIAVSADPTRGMSLCEQWKATALGALSITSRGDLGTSVPCAYWHPPAFARAEHIDALLVLFAFRGTTLGQLIVNPHGRRAEQMLKSGLFEGVDSGAYTLERLEAEGALYILAPHLRTSNVTEEERLAWLAERYGLQGPITLDMQRVTAGVTVRG